jgi:hypothetical protein
LVSRATRDGWLEARIEGKADYARGITCNVGFTVPTHPDSAS